MTSSKIKALIDTLAPKPEFLKRIGEKAKRLGKDRLSMREIDAEIRAYRNERIKKGASRRSDRDRRIAEAWFKLENEASRTAKLERARRKRKPKS